MAALSFDPPAEPRDRVDVLSWALRISLCLYFLDAGLTKFPDTPQSMWVPMFAQIGFGQWFRVATGVIETAGAVLLLVPPLTPIAVILLGGTMIGAMLTHIVVRHDPGSSVIPLVFLLAVGGIGWRWRQSRTDGR